MRAAKYLGVAPWELLEQHPAWLYWALAYSDAETKAANARDRADRV